MVLTRSGLSTTCLFRRIPFYPIVFINRLRGVKLGSFNPDNNNEEVLLK